MILISSLPKEIGFLPSLLKLDVSGNTISFIPTSFTRLISLEFLNFSDNKIELFPYFLGYLPSLKVIFCQRNPFQNIQMNEITHSSVSLLCHIRNYLQEHDDEYHFDDEGMNDIKSEYDMYMIYRKSDFMNDNFIKGTVSSNHHPSHSSHSPSSLPLVNEEHILVNTIIITPFTLTNAILTIHSNFVRRRRNDFNNKG